MTSSQRRHIRLFVSSPGDVADERRIVLETLKQLRYDALLPREVELEPVAWDMDGADVPMLATTTPQAAINEGLPRPSECDIVIVIFWSRMGTPLPDQYRKPNGERYLSGTEWEYWDAYSAWEERGLPLIIVYRRTEEPVVGFRDANLMDKLEQYQRVENFFKKFVNDDGSLAGGINLYESPDEFRSKFDTHIRKLIQQMLAQPAQSDRDANGDAIPFEPWEGSPFPGLRAFTEAEAPIFAGRDHEIDQLLKKLAALRFMMVVGASGSGKSSLIHAGLVPRLREGAIVDANVSSLQWIFITVDVSRTPLEHLAEGLMHNLPALGGGDPLTFSDRVEKLVDMIRTKPQHLMPTVAFALRDAPPKTEVVLIMDQFEGVFTTADPADAASLLVVLGHLEAPFRLLGSIRADFYHKLVADEILAEHLRDGSFPLAMPSPVALYHMITRPAARALLELDEGLAERIVHDTGTEPGVLPLMAYLLDELYQRGQHSNRLTVYDYEALGGVQKAITQRAEDALTALPTSVQARLPSVVFKLVTVNDEGVFTRQRVPLHQVAITTDHEQLIQALIDKRLLVVSEQDAIAHVELAHEALLGHWPRLTDLLQTMRSDMQLRRTLAHATLNWVAHDHDSTYLWPHERLNTVYAMQKRLDVYLTADEKQFIRPEAERLLQELNIRQTTHTRRAEIGTRLTITGDPRIGTGVDADGLPTVDWISIPAGDTAFPAGSGNVQQVSSFFIARFPITHIQYQSFNMYLTTHLATYQHVVSQLVTADGWHYDDRKRYQPATHVSWFNAMAFCHWLTDRLREVPPPVIDNNTFTVRLPMEWEWQRAAGAGVYPWGDVWHGENANTRESGLGYVVNAGLYPQAASVFGVQGLCGNVNEWCMNTLAPPYSSDKIQDMQQRAVRGGSWALTQAFAATTYRDLDVPPFERSADIGFRVCLIP